MMHTRPLPAVRHPGRQRGVVLFIALIVLVAMSLAGIAMIRSVDTTLGVAGNMAFKQATIQSSDLGVNAAYVWLTAPAQTGAVLQNTNEAAGYFSSRPPTEPDWFDMANWSDAVCATPGCPQDASGNTIRYVVHRMCTEPDTPYGGTNAGVQNICALNVAAGGAGTGGSMSVGAVTFPGIPQLFYRITTRVDGPRNTISVIQVSVLIQV